jgi:hypothetical protein
LNLIGSLSTSQCLERLFLKELALILTYSADFLALTLPRHINFHTPVATKHKGSWKERISAHPVDEALLEEYFLGYFMEYKQRRSLSHEKS